MDDWPIGDYPLGRVVYLPCGGCISCRRERRQELTLLQLCEASLHKDNWFLTLTYEDQKTLDLTGLLPYSLDKSHLSDFVESMRKYCRYNNSDFRFFASGEYGELNERPHYHLSIFGLTPELLGLRSNKDVVDERRQLLNHRGKFCAIRDALKDNNGNDYWFSPVVDKRWPFGDHKLYRANRETFQYVAGYVVKKLTGQLAKDFKATGRIPEFQNQSRPSIGRPWFDKYWQMLSLPDGLNLVNDSLAIDDIEWKIPRIFSKWLETIDPFDGAALNRRNSLIRTKDFVQPDRADLKRKADFDRYSAERRFDKRSHKEVK